MRRGRIRIGVAGAAALVALALGGCGGGDGSSDPAATGPDGARLAESQRVVDEAREIGAGLPAPQDLAEDPQEAARSAREFRSAAARLVALADGSMAHACVKTQARRTARVYRLGANAMTAVAEGRLEDARALAGEIPAEVRRVNAAGPACRDEVGYSVE